MKHIFLTLTFLLSVNAQAKLFEERLISGDKAKKILSYKNNLDDEDSIFYESRLPSRKKFIPEDDLDYEVLNDEDTIISESRPAIKKRFASEDGIPAGDSISPEDLLPSENELTSEDSLPPEDYADSKINLGLDSQSKTTILSTAAATSYILDKVTGKSLKRTNKIRHALRSANLNPAQNKILKQIVPGKFLPKLIRAVSRLSGLATAAIAGYSIGEFIVEVDKNKYDGKLVNAVSTKAEPLFEQIYKWDKAIFGTR